MRHFTYLFAALVILFTHSAHASLTLFDDRQSFLQATGASAATGPLPDLNGVYSTAHVGSVTFQDVNGYSFWIGGLSSYNPSDWSTVLPGNELAINSVENLDVLFDAPVFSAGFDFVEPAAHSSAHPYANNAYYPFFDSTFTVTLSNAGQYIGQFQFNRAEEIAAFVGVWSDSAFDRMAIRETTGGIEDDYFGAFYSGTQIMPVPLPASALLFGFGLWLIRLTSAVRR